jgi:putative exosortase-associated protein (TIGR04073 family)
MKSLLLPALLLAGLAVTALADIQDPPANDYGPTRKLGRAFSNLTLGWSEIPVTIGQVNKLQGNEAAAGYGMVKGTTRAFARFGAGLYELLLWPIPVCKGTYRSVLPSDIPWIQQGYGEFPPELGSESKYPYVRNY